MSDKNSRRDFLTGLGRWGALAAIAALVGKLRLQAVRRGPAGKNPTNVCAQCPVFSGCDFPGAVRARGAGALPHTPRTDPGDQAGLCGARPGWAAQARLNRGKADERLG